MAQKQKKPVPPRYTPEELKEMRGVYIAETGGVMFIDVGKWKCKGRDKPWYYITQIGKDLFTCDCPDFNYRGFLADIKDNVIERQPSASEFKDCKHIFAVRHIIKNGTQKFK